MAEASPDTSERDRWTSLVNDLQSQIKGWATARGWDIHESEKSMDEPGLGAYAVLVLSLRLPSGQQVYVEPVARFVANAEGRVDLYTWPSLNRVLLVRQAGRWVLKTDSGVAWPQEWSEQTLADLVKNLSAAA